jgi:hypothetical protein
LAIIHSSKDKHGETAMTATAQDFWQEQADEPEVRIDGKVDPQREDAYWQSVYWGESYYRNDCSYDDYAPAYCVGYIGYAQYGGCFDDAEKSLCANWFRIKGDSRLSLDEAVQAIRAAWEHAAGTQLEVEEDELVEVVAARSRSMQQPAYA